MNHSIKAVALVDGTCALCSGLTRFAARRDPEKQLRFAALQSEEGQLLLKKSGLDPDRRDTFVLLKNGRGYTRSSAALELMGLLHGGWPLLRMLKIVPLNLRDAVYKLIAASRHKLVPNSANEGHSCQITDARLLQERVLDGEQATREFWQQQEALAAHELEDDQGRR
ncbi:thiol-disulfide oxidoreductase DCC family protein [Paenibacillus herberti]|uniref:Thiol-disulfide oxidoreductase DCC n=1 Tax=Paenibacillus herberti TaxID=1619309 RepID=A0A229NUR3_9BACL|nr:DCC1-like thiol-disulfide oxidoreductase family protein [Paenibacillus herberti]OXM13359.1 thiol-disulfide oxidoreductase DCC [Paenibacillus herberti]